MSEGAIKLPPVAIERCAGLGDHIYMRPFVIELCRQLEPIGQDVFLPTPWPQMWAIDPPRNLICVPDNTGYKVQTWNVNRGVEDCGAARIASELPRYVNKNVWMRQNLLIPVNRVKEFRSNLDFLCEAARVSSQFDLSGWRGEDVRMSVPGSWLQAGEELVRSTGLHPERTIFVKLPTVRGEWRAEGRCPDPAVFRRVLRAAKRETGMRILGHAALGVGNEVLHDASIVEECDATILDIRAPWTSTAGAMIACFANISPVCFALPLAISIRARMLTVFGGNQPPSFLIDNKLPRAQQAQREDYGYAAAIGVVPSVIGLA